MITQYTKTHRRKLKQRPTFILLLVPRPRKCRVHSFSNGPEFRNIPTRPPFVVNLGTGAQVEVRFYHFVVSALPRRPGEPESLIFLVSERRICPNPTLLGATLLSSNNVKFFFY